MNLDPIITLLGLAPAQIAPPDLNPAQMEHHARVVAIGNLMAERRCNPDEVRVGMLAAHMALLKGASAYRALELGLRVAMMLRVTLPESLLPEETARVH